MILEFFLAISGAVIFLLTGASASYLLFPRCNIIERVVYSIVLSVFWVTITGFFLYILGINSQLILVCIISLLLLIFCLFILRKNNKNSDEYKTFWNKDFLLIILFSAIGTAWRYWFFTSIKNFNSIYSYVGRFTATTIPDVGFYTGIIKDHANYVGTSILKKFLDYLYINSTLLETFLGVFIYLALIYLLFLGYRKSRMLAIIGVMLMALGPIEIFYTTSSFYGHPLAYIALFFLFLYFKLNKKNIFWVALLSAVYCAVTYYTASMAILLVSFGFIIASFAKDWTIRKSLFLTTKNIFGNKKMLGFSIIFMFLAIYLFSMSNMTIFTIKSATNLNNTILATQSIRFSSTENIESYINTPINLSNFYFATLYRDPKILGLSAMRWQAVFFFLCGLTFIIYLIFKRDFSPENLDLLLCLIPIAIVSSAFFFMNYPARIFDYFAFFGLLALTFPKKYSKIFVIAAFIFILTTSVCVAKDKKPFFENSQGEIDATKEIPAFLKGKIFSDEKFVNNLISNGYYEVTGTDDNNPLLIGLFYSNDDDLFLKSIQALNEGGVEYIATTKRMREKYVLMLNYPKINLINSGLYEKNLQKVYDNGDVKIYSTTGVKMPRPHEGP